jgi:hypothetical protein
MNWCGSICLALPFRLLYGHTKRNNITPAQASTESSHVMLFHSGDTGRDAHRSDVDIPINANIAM